MCNSTIGLGSIGRPTKPQRESGKEIVFRLSPGARKISGTHQLPNLEVGEYQRLIIRASAVFGPSRGGRVILCSYEVSTISKYNCHCISYNLIGLFDCFLATWKRFPAFSLFGVSLGDRGNLVQLGIQLGIQTNSNWQITRKSWRNMDKNDKYWGFMEQNESIKTQWNIVAGKEII